METTTMAIPNGSHNTFDNAFLSGCAWHKRLMVPLINEIFHKNISEDAFIEHPSNEHFRQGTDVNSNEKLIKRITDSLVRVDGGKYHLECESKNDGEILIRIAEYDMMIATVDASYEHYSVRMELPETAVIFLRNHRGIPRNGTITYYKGKQSLTHSIPFLEVGKFSLTALSEKHLFLLFPFYLIRYEHAIQHTPNKYAAIESEAQKVYDELVAAYDRHCLTRTEYENILLLCKDVVAEISRDTSIQERLVTIMGTEVLLTAEERGVVKGIQQGHQQGLLDSIRNLMQTTNVSFDTACDNLLIKDREQYRERIQEASA